MNELEHLKVLGIILDSHSDMSLMNSSIMQRVSHLVNDQS